MTNIQFAMVSMIFGVLTFFAGLYGIAGTFSFVLALVGIVLLLFGLIIFFTTLRRASFSRPHILVPLLFVLGVILHSYELIAFDNFSFGFFFWALMPYVFCLTVSTLAVMRIPAIAAIAVTVLFDLIVHYEVFVLPTSSTSALLLLFAPLWNTLVFSPIAMVATWLYLRYIHQ